MKKIDITCIIDDDPIFVFGIKKLMELADFCEDFLVFRNGLEALNNLKDVVVSGEKIPDIILLDLNMPIVDGWQFLEEFVKVKCAKKITIYIVSSSVDPKDVLRAKSYEQVTDYVVKPISRDSLNKIIDNFQEVA